MQATALIAEDEPLLAAHLQAELQRLWPELRVLATVGDGASALRDCLALAPDIVFLDIRMPGMNGLDAAQALAEDWPDSNSAGAPPLIVFVTAYDEYAVRAFERAALDYVLKPVQPERLARTCERLREALARRSALPDKLEPLVTQLRGLLGMANVATGPGIKSGVLADSEPLRMIQASAGSTITMIPVDEVLFFESADKYVRVVTVDREHLIRLSLRDLLQRLDAQTFWQIHRGTVVRADAIASASRDEAGKLTLRLRDHEARLVVSRLYADRFKGM